MNEKTVALKMMSLDENDIVVNFEKNDDFTKYSSYKLDEISWTETSPELPSKFEDYKKILEKI